MPVSFPQFDIEEVEDDTPKDVKQDLDIINGANTIENVSPFVTAPAKKQVFKPAPPSVQQETHDKVVTEDKEIVKEQKRTRKKRELSEKQRAHLEKMRAKKAQKKIEQVKETIQSTDNKLSVPEYVEPTPDELQDMEKSEFDAWLKNMSKFEKIMKAMQLKKEKELEAQQKKEAAIEAKYRAKFEAEQKAKQAQQTQAAKPAPAQTAPASNFNPVQQAETNPYDSYFSF